MLYSIFKNLNGYNKGVAYSDIVFVVLGLFISTPVEAAWYYRSLSFFEIVKHPLFTQNTCNHGCSCWLHCFSFFTCFWKKIKKMLVSTDSCVYEANLGIFGS